MAREGEAAEILQALGKLPDDVLQRFLPAFPVERIRDALHAAVNIFPKPAGKTIKAQPLFPEQNTPKQKGSLFLYTDGASRGNPGDAGAGMVIL
ncbi:MAG: hypothetical protein KJ717_00210, partial [Proteobacteria bacterium]|nr:hypothetical protein [Pseudomonadota bacterium]